MIEVKVTQVKGTKTKDFMRALGVGVNKALEEAAEQAAKATVTLVKKEYRSSAGSSGRPKPAKSSIMRRRLGKTTGVADPVPVSSSRRSLYYTGELARNVMAFKIKARRWVVGIKPGAMSIPHGSQDGPVPLSDLARMHEKGYTRVVALSTASLAYLSILFGRASGSSGGGQSVRRRRNLELRKFAIVVPARPVWKTVATKRSAEFMSILRTASTRRLRQVTLRYMGR